MYKFILKIIKYFLIYFNKALYKRAPKIKASHYYQIRDVIKEGDILLSYRSNLLNNLITNDKYFHCGIYTNEGVVEATVLHGVTKTDLLDFCINKDRLCIIRPFLTDEAIQRFICYALSRVGADYDFYFETSVDTNYYCSELVYFCLIQTWTLEHEQNIDVDLIPYYNNKIITPQNIYKALSNYIVIELPN